MHFKIHRSTIYNSQDMEATKMFINREMDKKATVHGTHVQEIIPQPQEKNEIMPFSAT